MRPQRSAGPGAALLGTLWRSLPAPLLRYLRLELAAWLGSLAAGALAWKLCPRVEVLAAAAVLGESSAFYATAWFASRRAGAGRRRDVVAGLRALLSEFALAEGLDVLVVRPLSIAAAAALVPPPYVAIALGGAAADLVFFGVAARCARRREPATRERTPSRLGAGA